MLLLKNDAKIIEHFSSVAAKLFLYVGSDIIIRSLSEAYLAPESRTTVNLLKILRDSGATLALTEKTVDEVATHIRRQIYEFENMYAATEHHVKFNVVEYIDRILIRAYFYAKLIPEEGVLRPQNWRSYISQFCNYADVKGNNGDHELGDYLIRKFDLVYESTDDMEKSIDKLEIEQLSDDIEKVRERAGKVKRHAKTLAYNDALQVLRVYQRRLEKSRKSERLRRAARQFGFVVSRRKQCQRRARDEQRNAEWRRGFRSRKSRQRCSFRCAERTFARSGFAGFGCRRGRFADVIRFTLRNNALNNVR